MIGKRPHAAASAAVPQQQPPASAAEAEASVALESQMEGQLEQSLPSSVPRKLYALKQLFNDTLVWLLLLEQALIWVPPA